MYVGVAEHFREHCWMGIQCRGREMGFLGRVGRPLSKALSHKGTSHAEMTSLARAAGEAVTRIGKETSALISSQMGSPSFNWGLLHPLLPPQPITGSPRGKLTMVSRPGELERLDPGAWPLLFSHRL